MKEYISYFRSEIDSMQGYVPGEQPKGGKIIKLNTNESPYAPSPAVKQALLDFDYERLRLYPDPVFTELKEEIASRNGLAAENVIAGNGSDDILTITARCFTSKDKALASFDPSYSLYPTLAGLQGAPYIAVPLDKDFNIPSDVLDQVKGANCFMIARPNAPTGNLYPKKEMERICAEFDGIVFIDEAYGDFAEDTCADLVKKYSNVIVSRTFSKSRCLAGLRFGYALAHEKIIEGMVKMKDSYNVAMLTQKLALASLRDKEYFARHIERIKENRTELTEELAKLGFKTIPSQSNFLFTIPPCGGEKYFLELKKRNILIRYFSAERTKDFVRITVGSKEEHAILLQATKEILELK